MEDQEQDYGQKVDKILTFIEIQMGTYFGEDNIVRIDDFYERK